jgi:hypothetical protein
VVKMVYKYHMSTNDIIPANEQFEIEMPIGAEILTIQLQGQDPQPMIWAKVNPLAEKEKRKFWAATTGTTIPKDSKYLATLQFNRGAFVVHVFELIN